MNRKRALPDEYGGGVGVGDGYDDDDDFFLSEAAAIAEAHALSLAKRYRSTPATAKAEEGKPRLQEGAYLAALRADDAPRQQQHKTFSSLPSRVKAAAGDQLGFGGDGACFKCGESGHWARDCTSAGAAGGAIGRPQPSEPEKACPCGVGVCTVLTANTERNRGRRFYRCPVREENGGCGFFQWCDGDSVTTNPTTASFNSNFTSSFPDMSCPCGAGSCLILTAKTGNNVGRQFYRCPNQGGSCGFFKWCNDQTAVAAGLPSVANKSYDNHVKNTNYGTTGSSSCFKCGKEGHWAKDCPLSADFSTAPTRNPSSSSSGTCYKCGNPGHWARDCTSSKR